MVGESHVPSLYPVALVDRLDGLTVTLHKAEKRGGRGEPALKEEIRRTVRELSEVRPPRAGDTVAGARLMEVIGSGNFGDVWEAEESATGKAVAVKTFHANKMGLSLTLHYFRRGVEAMDKLTHCKGRPESVIELLHVEPSRLAFSMPLMPRTDLSRTINNWSVEKKVAFFKAVCEAVRFAHANQVLHRDIKPENILVTESLKPVLTDFDICDLLYKNTLSTQATGTVLYASPEQLQGTNERSFSSDVYSLGRILHFLLLEKNPIILHERLPSLNDLHGKPEGLVRIVRKCTQFEPERRYQTVDELLADVRRCEANPECIEVGVSGTATAPAPRRSWFSEHQGAAATIIAAAMAAIASILVVVIPMVSGKGDQPGQPAPKTSPPPSIAPSSAPPDVNTMIRIDKNKVTPKETVVARHGGYLLMGIPGGELPLGVNSEHATHLVKIEPFYLGKYEVTNEEYDRFLKANPKVDKPEYRTDKAFNQPKQPVVGVSWDDAKSYCAWAGLRLPSEAEWEWAARAGTTTLYYSGDKESDLKQVGWYRGNSEDRLHPVGEREKNEFGLYDMLGNVLEWVEDDWHDNYDGVPEDGRAWVDVPRAGSRVRRGGSWLYAAGHCRSAYRDYALPGYRGNLLGFRPSRSIP